MLTGKEKLGIRPNPESPWISPNPLDLSFGPSNQPSALTKIHPFSLHKKQCIAIGLRIAREQAKLKRDGKVKAIQGKIKTMPGLSLHDDSNDILLEQFFDKTPSSEDNEKSDEEAQVVASGEQRITYLFSPEKWSQLLPIIFPLVRELFGMDSLDIRHRFDEMFASRLLQAEPNDTSQLAIDGIAEVDHDDELDPSEDVMPNEESHVEVDEPYRTYRNNSDTVDSPTDEGVSNDGDAEDSDTSNEDGSNDGDSTDWDAPELDKDIFNARWKELLKKKE
ncbi:uncharacterized protein LOC129571648 [Sitodiplosis mosellana]|uniref:uncharacterized protein LOC129571648 n=1 Tax=Sitodiplosis mosellana TaxID=263140 RepID=UPI0024444E48|nr:uncharacterized protein LOC129571648 [Sitodiplosis mosellana]